MSFALQINDKQFNYFTTLQFERSLENLCHTLQINITEEANLASFNINLGDAYKLFTTEGVQLSTGFIDLYNHSISGNNRSIQLAGRSICQDLVDSTTIASVGGTLLSAAQDLCQPFGIEVLAEVQTNNLETTELEAEDPWAYLQEQADNQNLIFIENEKGQLIITKGNPEGILTNLTLGNNILKIAIEEKASDQYSQYIAVIEEGENITIDNPNITRHRPLHLNNNLDQTLAQAQDLAKKEQARRAGLKATVAVQGLNFNDTNPFIPNRRIKLEATAMGVSQIMLIEKVSMALSATGGTITTLELVEPASYNI